jgi:nicotinamide-nucleotide amidase
MPEQRFVPAVQAACAELAAQLAAQSWMLATAESCTGGMIAAACTDLAGSSGWFDRGFVTYSNEAKAEMLGVNANLIQRCGAVSQEVAQAMARGALEHSNAQLAVAVTGIAGPTGGSDAKPVGTVWFAWASPTQLHSECRRFPGDRAQIRLATVQHALAGLLNLVQATPQ